MGAVHRPNLNRRDLGPSVELMKSPLLFGVSDYHSVGTVTSHSSDSDVPGSPVVDFSDVPVPLKEELSYVKEDPLFSTWSTFYPLCPPGTVSSSYVSTGRVSPFRLGLQVGEDAPRPSSWVRWRCPTTGRRRDGR